MRRVGVNVNVRHDHQTSSHFSCLFCPCPPLHKSALPPKKRNQIKSYKIADKNENLTQKKGQGSRFDLPQDKKKHGNEVGILSFLKMIPKFS